jgi:hypothetical protein
MRSDNGEYAVEQRAADRGGAEASKAPKTRRRRNLVRVCAWCRRICDGSGVWRRGRVLPSQTPTHGICPRCIDRFFPPETFPESSE